jgi:hypothetical protein
MKIIGVELRKPSFGEITAAAVLAAGLWMAIVALWRTVGAAPLDRIDAGALLLVVFWGCICVRLGIRVERGPRHLALNVAFCALLVAVYQAAVTLFG